MNAQISAPLVVVLFAAAERKFAPLDMHVWAVVVILHVFFQPQVSRNLFRGLSRYIYYILSVVV